MTAAPEAPRAEFLNPLPPTPFPHPSAPKSHHDLESDSTARFSQEAGPTTGRRTRASSLVGRTPDSKSPRNFHNSPENAEKYQSSPLRHVARLCSAGFLSRAQRLKKCVPRLRSPISLMSVGKDFKAKLRSF